MATHACPDCDSPGTGNCPVCHAKGKIMGDETSGTFDPFGLESSCSAYRKSGECQTCGGIGEIEVGGEGG